MLPLVAAAALAQDGPPVVTVSRPEGDAPVATVPLRISVIPGVGLGADPHAHVDGASLGLWSQGETLRGADAELVVSWTTGEVRGAQGSLAANVSGDLRGVQGSAGINVANGDVDGVQGSTALNVARGRLRGVQGSAGLNVALGEGSEGLQAAPVNVANELDGVQAGLVNVADEVDGLQIGLVNVARSSDVSLGLVNVIGDGLHRVDVWTSESAVASVAAKFGSKHMYTLIGVGWLNTRQAWWTYGAGLGVHLPVGPLWLEVDDSVWGLATGNVVAPGVHNKLRAQVGLDLVKGHLAPFAGVSVNTWFGDGSVWPRAVGLPSQTLDHRQVVTWPGVHAGISF